MKILKWIKRLFADPPTLKRATYDFQKEEMTYELSNGTFIVFSGRGAIWYELPLYARCSSMKALELCRVWSYIEKYGKPTDSLHIKAWEI